MAAKHRHHRKDSVAWLNREDLGSRSLDVIHKCTEAYDKCKDRETEQGKLARCLKAVGGILDHLKAQGCIRADATTASLIEQLEHKVMYSRSKIAKYDHRPKLLSILFFKQREELKCETVREELNLIMNMLIARGHPAMIDALDASAAMPPDVSQDLIRQVQKRVCALRAAGRPHASAVDLEPHVEAVDNAVLDGVTNSQVRKNLRAVNERVAEQAPDTLKPLLHDMNELNESQRVPDAAPIEPVAEVADVDAAELGRERGHELKQQLMHAGKKGVDLDEGVQRVLASVFMCPVEKILFTVRGNGTPVRMRPCGCTVSKTAALAAEHVEGSSSALACPACQRELAQPPFKTDRRTMRLILAASEVEMVERANIQIQGDSHLGRGGEGVVYPGKWDGQQVAVKVCTVEFAIKRRVLDAWRVIAMTQLAGVASPCICQLLAVAWVPNKDEVYLVQQLCDEKLTAVVEEAAQDRASPGLGGLPPVDVALLVLELASACSAMYSKAKIVHRDLTPQNVLLRDRVACVIDFGIAGQVATATTIVQTVAATRLKAGKFNYAPPEQGIHNVPPHPAMDVYGIGATAVFAATNTAPYDNANEMTVLKKHSNNIAMAVPAELPRDLHDLLSEMVSLDWRSRPSMEEVLVHAKFAFLRLAEQSPPRYLRASQRYGLHSGVKVDQRSEQAQLKARMEVQDADFRELLDVADKEMRRAQAQDGQGILSPAVSLVEPSTLDGGAARHLDRVPIESAIVDLGPWDHSAKALTLPQETGMLLWRRRTGWAPVPLTQLPYTVVLDFGELEVAEATVGDARRLEFNQNEVWAPEDLAKVMAQVRLIQELPLENHDLREKGARVVVGALAALTSLTMLSLYNCNLGPKGMSALTPALEKLTGLQVLALGSNALGPQGAAVLVEPLARLTALTYLSLWDSHLQEAGARTLAPVLRGLPRLHKLVMCYNKLKDEGVRALLKDWNNPQMLRVLVIHTNTSSLKAKSSVPKSWQGQVRVDWKRSFSDL